MRLAPGQSTRTGRVTRNLFRTIGKTFAQRHGDARRPSDGSRSLARASLRFLARYGARFQIAATLRTGPNGKPNAMKLFRRRSAESETERRVGILEDFERVLRRVKAIAFLAPVLLLVGFGAGTATNRALQLPEDRQVRARKAEDVPRMKLEALSRHMHNLRTAGTSTAEYVSLYNEL